jgi:hypothetical protein
MFTLGSALFVTYTLLILNINMQQYKNVSVNKTLILLVGSSVCGSDVYIFLICIRREKTDH